MPPLARNLNFSYHQFFQAWNIDSAYSATPITTALWSTDGHWRFDIRQDRQFGGYGINVGEPKSDSLLDSAHVHPGQLYIHADEPDMDTTMCVTPDIYAGRFHDFVLAIQDTDATARFSPAGVADHSAYNWKCPTMPHDTAYAQQFYDYYQTHWGTPPVAEWHFHDFGGNILNGDVTSWYSRVAGEAAWAIRHGAPMVLSWGFHGWTDAGCAFQRDMEQAMSLLWNDSRINAAIWWSYNHKDVPHFLRNADGSLTAEGLAYSAPVLDVPSSVSAVGFSGGRARIQWTNTNAEQQIEAEFWRKPVGGSFSLDHSEFVSANGTATPIEQFTVGDQIKGRASYYYPLYSICGPWSDFSSTILLH